MSECATHFELLNKRARTIGIAFAQNGVGRIQDFAGKDRPLKAQCCCKRDETWTLSPYYHT